MLADISSNENVKTEIQHRVNNTDQSYVNCQGAPATEKQPGNFLTMAEIYALTIFQKGSGAVCRFCCQRPLLFIFQYLCSLFRLLFL